jgi:hypothetical protein
VRDERPLLLHEMIELEDAEPAGPQHFLRVRGDAGLRDC